LVNALKVEIVPTTYVAQQPGQKTQQTFATATVTDRALVDFGAVDPNQINFDHVARDCELLVEALREHPDVIRKALEVVCGGPPTEAEITSATAAITEIGLTEQGTRERGGGVVAVVLVVAAVVLLGGCLAECPPPQPQVPVSPGPPDGGTG